MKKLVYLLILSLCVNGLAEAALPWPSSARAASKTEEKAEKKSAKKSKKEKAEKTSKDQSGKSDKKEKKTKVGKEKEYTLDLAKNCQVALSDVLKYTKMDIKLKDVKSIELEDKKDKKRISWEKVEDDDKTDYIITVLKDFKELKLRVVTSKTSRLLVLKNGAKDAGEGEEKAERGDQAGAEAAKAPAGEKQEKPVEEKGEAGEAPAESAKEAEEAAVLETEKAPSGEKKEEPAGDRQEKSAAETPETPAEEQAEEATEAPAGEKNEEPAEATDADTEQDRAEEEKQTEVENDTEADSGKAEPQADGAETRLEESTSSVTESAMDGAEGLSDSSQDQGQGATEAGQQAGSAEGQGGNTEAQAGNTEAQGGNTEAQAGNAEAQGDNTEAQAGSAEAQAGSAEGQAESAEAREESGEAQGVPGGEQAAPGGEQGATGEGQAAPAEARDEAGEARDEGAADQGAPDGAQAEAGEEGGAGTADAEQGEPPADADGSGDEAPQPETGASIPGEAEAWFKRGIELLWGPLDALIAQLTGGETVYIQTDKLMLIREAPTQLLSTVTLLPDGDAFKGSYSVLVSTDNPTLVARPAALQPEDLPSLGDVADLYVWVKPDEEPSGEDEEQGDEEKPTLVVTATGFEPSGWSRTQPQFTLSGIPEGKDWSYAAIIYDERFVPVASNVYAPDQEGVFTLRFAMLNELGDIMAASDQYTLQLDWTAPEVTIEVDEETSYTLNISAVDKASGLDAVSVDKGKTWQPIDEDGYTVTEEAEKTFKAGAIRVRDVAGNVYKSEQEYTVQAVEDEEGDGEGEDDEGGEGGGGGGGGGSGTPALPHSRGDGEEGADYDALTLDLPDAPMERLTVGGEPMELTLTLASAQESGAPVGANQPFTGRLCHWKDASNSDSANTLLLEAEMADDLGDAFTYEWHFNGEVYRMLANSGIKYLALKVADTVAAFPTEGFTGGTRYTELKMQGVSTRKFDYTLTMKLNLDPSHVSAMNESDYSQECDLSIHTVVEETNYELSNSPQSMMYFYNVFLGPEDMMDQPFGEYRANA